MSPYSGGQLDGVIVGEFGIGERHLLGEGEELESPLTTLTGTEMEGAVVVVVEGKCDVDVMVAMIPGEVEGAIVEIAIGDDGVEVIGAGVHGAEGTRQEAQGKS